MSSDHQIREGGDIYASDMVTEEIPSQINDFFAGKTIFLTGATGFLGKLFLEKLLRTCDVNRIYILIRCKKGVDQAARFREMFNVPSFDPLTRKYPNFTEKLTVLNGDCSLPNLGLSPKDVKVLVSEIDIVIHCAATVRFDQTIKSAAHINVRATRDLLEIAKQMKKLKCFLHVSTAYSNSTRSLIKEEFYKPPMTSEDLLNLVDMLPDETLDEITKTLLGEYPNTYIYTKNVTEDMVRRHGRNLPMAVLRPSIIIGSLKEPVAGWIDNYYGATGVSLGAGLGVLRSAHGNQENIADLIPVDVVVNCGLATVWWVGRKMSLGNQENAPAIPANQSDSEVPIYNVVSSAESKITWSRFMHILYINKPNAASTKQVWAYTFQIRSCKYHHDLAVFFYQTVPAYLADFVCWCIGKEQNMVENYRKIAIFSQVISYFLCREWQFTNENTQELWQNMNAKDRELFEFSMKKFDWDSFLLTYLRGIRVYLVKDPLDTLAEGVRKDYWLQVLHNTLLAVFYLIGLYIFYVLFRRVFL